MLNTMEHMTLNILYKNLSDPKVKEYYTLDEINAEMLEYEDAGIAPVNEQKKPCRDVLFHINYRDFLFNVKCYASLREKDPTVARIDDFVKLAMVV